MEKIKIIYHDLEQPKLCFIENKSDWIDLRSAEAVEMKAGDCVNIPAGVKHWHGAAPDSWFSHLAVEVPAEEGSNQWLEKVTDEEYSKATGK